MDKLFDPTKYTIQTFDDTEQDREELAQIFLYDKARIEKLQKQLAGAFYCINPQENPNVRSIKNTKEWQSLGLDIDVAKEEEHLSGIELELKKKESFAILEKLKDPPNYVGITKNGLNAIWLWQESIKLPDTQSRENANYEYQQLIKGFGEKTGIKYDLSGNNIARVFRLPESLHQKDPKNPFKIQFKVINPNKINFESFKELYFPVVPEISRENKPFDFLTAFGAKTGTRNEVLKHAIPSLINKHDIETAWLLTNALNNTFPEPLHENELKYKFEKFREFVKNNPLQKRTDELNIGANPAVEWPKPLAPEAFHGPIGELTRAIGPHTEADEAAILTNNLTAFGNLIGDKPHFKHEANRHPGRIFLVHVGPTAEGMKGTAFGYTKMVFEKIEPGWEQRLQGGIGSGEAIVYAVRDEERKEKTQRDGTVEQLIVDSGVEDKRQMFLEDEFSSILTVMARKGSILGPIIRRSWDSGNLQNLVKNSPLKATGAHISFFCHITPEELQKCLSETDMQNGFCNRFLWICTKRSKLLPRGGSLQESTLEPIIEKLKKAYEFAKYAGEFTRSKEAWEQWEALYPALSKPKQGLIDSLTSRTKAYISRISLIYAAADGTDVIERVHQEAALANWDYNEASVRYIFQNQTGDAVANRIYGALLKKKNEGMTRTEIFNLFEKNVSSERISIALEILRREDLAKYETKASGGRDVEIWKTTINTFNT